MFNGAVSVEREEKVLEMMVLMVEKQCVCTSCHKTIHWKLVKVIKLVIYI